MSGRVTRSGNMPPVCSNRVRRSACSETPKRAAMPGRCQTGSMAIFVTEMSPDACSVPPSGARRCAPMAARISGMLRRALVMAIVGRMSDAAGDLVGEDLADDMAPGVERHDPLGVGPLRVRADAGGRMGVGEVRPRQRVERPRRDRQRPVERIGAAMGADDVAVGRVRHRADHRPALLRLRRPPADRTPRDAAARLRVRGQADMGRAIRGAHGRELYAGNR